MSTKYCCVLGLSLFLEEWIGDGQGSVSQWLFADGKSDPSSILDEQDKEALNCKANYANSFKRAIESDPFTEESTGGNKGKLGTLNTLRRGGASKDDTDYRARWKARRIQDRYTDIQLDWQIGILWKMNCVGCNYQCWLKGRIGYK